MEKGPGLRNQSCQEGRRLFQELGDWAGGCSTDGAATVEAVAREGVVTNLAEAATGYGWACNFIASSCCQNRLGVRYHTPCERYGGNGTREATRAVAGGNVSFALS